MNKIMNSKETASYLGISISTLYKYKSKGIIKSYKPNGKLLYFRKEDLDDYLGTGENLTVEAELDRINVKLNKNNNYD